MVKTERTPGNPYPPGAGSWQAEVADGRQGGPEGYLTGGGSTDSIWPLTTIQWVPDGDR